MCKLFTIFVLVCLFSTVVLSNYEDELEVIENDEIHFRVANGKPALAGQIPNQISFKRRVKGGKCLSFCGGTIISRKKILTAGHCFAQQNRACDKTCKTFQIKGLSKLWAVAGTLRNVGRYVPDSNKTTEQWRKIKRAVVPKGFSFPKQDICVVFTYYSFNYNAYVKKMPLASRDMDYANKYCLASGFGRTAETTKSAILQWAYLKVISRRLCSHIHKKNMRDFVCTESGITHTMKGDSGGPLMCLNTSDPADKGHGVIVGIVSGAMVTRYPKKKEKRDTYFTRVSKYKNFIRNSTSRLYLPDFYVIWLPVIIFMFD